MRHQPRDRTTLANRPPHTAWTLAEGSSGRVVQPLRILLAEDDRDLRSLLCMFLRDDGHHVVEACDGQQLFEEVQTSVLDRTTAAIDLIISDQRMPGHTGLDVLATLRAAGARTGFILTTAFGDGGVRHQAVNLGAMVIDKPFDFPSLRDGIAEVAASLHPSF